MNEKEIRQKIYNKDGCVKLESAKQFFMSLGISEEDSEKLVDKLIYNYDLLVNPEYVICNSGTQIFGSADYYAGYKVWKGSVKIIEERDISNGFISACECKIIPAERPTVISCYAGDSIGREQRVFKAFVAVWL